MGSGILIIAHGSSRSAWIQMVDDMTRKIDLPLPLVTCFLELVENRSISDGINELVQQGVSNILAVPLFVSSGSMHIAEIAGLLGLGKEHAIPPLPAASQVRIHLCPAMDAHPLIVQIVLERARELSQNERDEILFLVAHGSTEPAACQRWDLGIAELKRQLRQQSDFFSIQHAYLHDEQFSKQLQVNITKKQVIVVPLFVSEGYFTRKLIPQKINQMSVRYTGKTYLPHPLIVQWIEKIIKREWVKVQLGKSSWKTKVKNRGL